MEKQMMNLRYEPSKYSRRELAFNSLKHCVKPHRVMLGCDNKYWVVCPADAARLERLGYEYAE